MLIYKFAHRFTYIICYIQLFTYKLLSCIAHKLINCGTFLTPNNSLVLSNTLFVDNDIESSNCISNMSKYAVELPQTSIFSGNSTIEQLEQYSNSVDAISLIIHHNELIKLYKVNDLQKYIINFPKSKRMDKTRAPLMKIYFLPSITHDLSNWPKEAQKIIASVDHVIASDKLYYTYNDLSLSEALYLLAPNDNFQSISFETIGHIAHLNLTENRIPIKHLIGKVIYDVGIV